MDSKVIYLAKTLSRTKRKDYENYVVNAIWNRVNDSRLVPVSQQFIKNNEGNYYFIDLYFPQLKIGIECDEGYHSTPEQKILDAEREATIIDVMKQVDGSDYTALHVDVTKSFNEVESQINEHVNAIKRKMEELNIEDGWSAITKEARHAWKTSTTDAEHILTADEAEIAEYFKDKEYITITDNIVFPSNKEVYNIILGQNYSYHLMHGGEPFKKLYTEYGYEEIEERFGTLVADMVSDLSEDMGIAKWFDRKKDYVKRMKANYDVNVINIVIADKIHELTIYYDTFMSVGDKVWKNTSGNKEEKGWLYREIYNIAKSAKANSNLLNRYKKLLILYFGDLDE